MNSIGSILASTKVAPKSADLPKRPPMFSLMHSEARPFKVTLAVQIVAEIEVMARTPEEADRIAEARAKEAKRVYRSEPHGFRECIRKLVDYRDPSKGFKWVRLEQVRGEDGNLHWAEGSDD
ncbi:MAG: hypothetical protein NTV51_10575 [Verrucomicrobia bacterium]|nr:hypothetical protein [Verrucomicrobiota bacterium]